MYVRLRFAMAGPFKDINDPGHLRKVFAVTCLPTTRARAAVCSLDNRAQKKCGGRSVLA